MNETIYINGKMQCVPHGVFLSELFYDYPEFHMPCAGNGRCGKCRVKVKGTVSTPDEMERKLLTEEEMAAGVRLACRTKLLGTCEISIPKVQGDEVILSQKQENRSFISELPLFKTLGAAVDIGTTTLAVSLYDRTGLLGKEGGLNPQISFGADVISRIQKSLDGEGAALAKAVRMGICELLNTICQKSGHQIEEIDTVVVTGNTAMLYLYTERCPSSLSHAPFRADWLAGEWMPGEKLGYPNARVYLARCMSAFVGADSTTALLATQISRDTKKRLLADIGTNGEIALWTGQEIRICSVAAGPALEGVGLSMGMRAAAGAVCNVSLSGTELKVQIIGNQEPVGICGSGVIDAVSCLLQAGRMDETGYLEEGQVQIAGKVKLTQEDIRNVQLAKGAICAGIETLLHQEQLQPEELEELLVAGGFGSRLNLENAIRIGLLPQVEQEKITVCQNAAFAGAELLLCRKELLAEERKISELSRCSSLAEDVFFQKRYIERMLFSDIA